MNQRLRTLCRNSHWLPIYPIKQKTSRNTAMDVSHRFIHPNPTSYTSSIPKTQKARSRELRRREEESTQNTYTHNSINTNYYSLKYRGKEMPFSVAGCCFPSSSSSSWPWGGGCVKSSLGSTLGRVDTVHHHSPPAQHQHGPGGAGRTGKAPEAMILGMRAAASRYLRFILVRGSSGCAREACAIAQLR